MPRTTPVIVMSSVGGGRIRPDVEALGDAEIGDLRVPVLLQEDVAGLDVAVQHPARVGGRQRVERLGHHEQDALGRQRPPGDDLVAQRGPGQALHHEIGRRVIFAEVQHGDDVGMDEPCGDQRLLLEPLPHARERPRLGPQDLHRRLALETLVEGVEDSGHAALAQEAVDAVPPSDQGRRARLHRGLCTPSAGSVVVPPDAVSPWCDQAEALHLVSRPERPSHP